jgi:hypothetical protein
LNLPAFLVGVPRQLAGLPAGRQVGFFVSIFFTSPFGESKKDEFILSGAEGQPLTQIGFQFVI